MGGRRRTFPGARTGVVSWTRAHNVFTTRYDVWGSLSCLSEASISATTTFSACACHSQRPPPRTTLHAHHALLRVRASMTSRRSVDHLYHVQSSPGREGFSLLPSEDDTTNHGTASILPLVAPRQVYRFVTNVKHGRLVEQNTCRTVSVRDIIHNYASGFPTR